MKTIKKTIYMLLCVFVLSTAAGLACLFMPTNAFTFADTGVTADLYMEEGASVRTDRAGVRFRTYIKKTYYDGLTEPETGIFVIPSDLLDGELNETTVKAKNIVSMADPLTDGDYYVFSNVLTQIPENSYGRALTARSYVKVNGEYIFADNPQTRSLAYVSQAALYADSGLEESDKTALCGYVDSAVQSFTAPSDAITLSDVAALNLSVVPVYGEDDLSNLLIPVVSSNPAAVTVNNGNITPVSAGLSEITATLGSRSVTFGAIVNGDNQDIVMTDSAHSLALSIPDGCTVSSITCKEESWGNDLSALTVSDTLKETKTGHGETTAQVVVNGSKSYTLTVPVTLVTAKIADVTDWKNNIWPQTATDSVYGYYVLSQNISHDETGFNLNMHTSGNGNNGFLGTLDGRGYSISISAPNGFGLFGDVGEGAVVKNLTVNKLGKSSGWNASLFGYVIASNNINKYVTIENIVVNIKDATDTDTVRCGVFTRDGAWGVNFKDVTVNIENSTILSLFGANMTAARGLNPSAYSILKCSFDNFVINMDEKSVINEIGHRGNIEQETADVPLTVFTADGHTLINTPTWATVEKLTGITVKAKQNIVATVDTNYFVITESVHSLDLGKYSSGYTVQSITSGGTDLGTDVSNVALSGSTAGSSGSISVVLKNDSGVVNLTVPVIWVTAKIATAEDWKTYMWCDVGGSITGYYVLANDITVNDSTLTNTNLETSYLSGETGFRGTLDGAGHKIEIGESASVGRGLVNTLGSGAKIQNITITNNFPDTSAKNPGYKSNQLFGMLAYGATLSGVTINLNNCNFSGTAYGPLTYEGFKESTVENLTINITGHVASIVGGTNNYLMWYNMKKAENIVINLIGGATLDEIRHDGNPNASPSSVTKIYYAEGMTVDETNELYAKIEGFKVNQVAAETETLSERQDVSLAAESFSLNLGAYSDYNVKSIAYGEDIIGNDISNVVITEEIKKKSF